MSLSEREFKCECCGTVIDRDKNASVNLSRYKTKSIIKHLTNYDIMYRELHGNLSLWSVISNVSSFSKSGHSE